MLLLCLAWRLLLKQQRCQSPPILEDLQWFYRVKNVDGYVYYEKCILRDLHKGDYFARIDVDMTDQYTNIWCHAESEPYYKPQLSSFVVKCELYNKQYVFEQLAQRQSLYVSNLENLDYNFIARLNS